MANSDLPVSVGPSHAFEDISSWFVAFRGVWDVDNSIDGKWSFEADNSHCLP